MILALARSVRFCLTRDSEAARGNSWAGAPQVDAMTPWVTLTATVIGRVKPETGYLCNVKTLDDILREYAVPIVVRYHHERPDAPLSGVMLLIRDALIEHGPPAGAWSKVTLHATPYLSCTAQIGITPMTKEELAMVQMTYSFEFSAAHRLYCSDRSESENERIFGRCANANGHGHNYVVEVTVCGCPDAETGAIVPLPEFERIVNETVIDRFDHKHLNLDCPEFATLNPTVENITRVIHDRLDGAFSPASLAKVRVYETPKTYAEYPA